MKHSKRGTSPSRSKGSPSPLRYRETSLITASSFGNNNGYPFLVPTPDREELTWKPNANTMLATTPTLSLQHPFRCGSVLSKRQQEQENRNTSTSNSRSRARRSSSYCTAVSTRTALLTQSIAVTSDRVLRAQAQKFVNLLQLESNISAQQKKVDAPSTPLGPGSKSVSNMKPLSPHSRSFRSVAASEAGNEKNRLNEKVLRVIGLFLPTSYLARGFKLVHSTWKNAANTVSCERRVALEVLEKGELRTYRDGYSVFRFYDGVVWEGAYDEANGCHGFGVLTFPLHKHWDVTLHRSPADVSFAGAHSVRGHWAHDAFVDGTILYRNGDVYKIFSHCGPSSSVEYMYGNDGCTIRGTLINSTWHHMTPTKLANGVKIPKVAILFAGGAVVLGWLTDVTPETPLPSLRHAVEQQIIGLHSHWDFDYPETKPPILREALRTSRGQFMHFQTKSSNVGNKYRRRCGWPSTVPIHNGTVFAVIIHSVAPVSASESFQRSQVGVTPTKGKSAGGFGASGVIRALKEKSRTAKERVESAPYDQCMDCIREGNLTGVTQLCEKHPHILTQPNLAGRTAMHYACECGQQDIVEFLMSRRASMVCEDANGQTPLHYAARRGHAAVLATLLQQDEVWKKINAQDVRGDTCLHIALKRKYVNTALWIVEQGARMDLEDDEGWTASQLARVMLPDISALCKGANDVTVIRCFLKCLPIRTILKSGMKVSHTHREDVDSQTIEDLLVSLAYIERYDTPIDQSLMYASYLRLKITEGSLAFPLQPHLSVTRNGMICKNYLRITVLHEIAELGDSRIVSMLLQCPIVDVNATNIHGQTALHRAAARRHTNVVALLLYDGRTSVAIQDKRGCTALHIAIRGHAYEAVQLLVHRMTLDEVHLLDEHGYSAFHYAAAQTNPLAQSCCVNIFLRIKSLEFQPQETTPKVKQTALQRCVQRRREKQRLRCLQLQEQQSVAGTPQASALQSAYASTAIPIIPPSTIILSQSIAKVGLTAVYSATDNDVSPRFGLGLLAACLRTNTAGAAIILPRVKPLYPPIDSDTGFAIPTPNWSSVIHTAVKAGNAKVLEELLLRNRYPISAAAVVDSLCHSSLQCFQLLMANPNVEIPIVVDTVPLVVVGLRKGHITSEWLNLSLPFYDPWEHGKLTNLFDILFQMSCVHAAWGGLPKGTPPEGPADVTCQPPPKSIRRPLNKSHKNYHREKSLAIMNLVEHVARYFHVELSYSGHVLCRHAAKTMLQSVGTAFFPILRNIVVKSKFNPDLDSMILVDNKRVRPNYALQAKFVSADGSGGDSASGSALTFPMHTSFQAAIRAEQDIISVLDACYIPTSAELVLNLCRSRYFQAALAVVRNVLPHDNVVNMCCSYVNDGMNALHSAASYGKTELVQALLSTGNFSVTGEDDLGLLPIHYAARGGHSQTIQLLIRAGSPVDIAAPSFAAAMKYSYGWCEIAQDAEPQTSNPLGITPLHLAAKYGNVDAVRVLLQGGANIHRLDKVFNSALHLAVAGGDRAVSGYLVESGANVEAVNRCGDSPILIAAKRGYEIILNMLVTRPKNASKQFLLHKNEKTGHTVAHYAAMYGFVQVLEQITMFERSQKPRQSQSNPSPTSPTLGVPKKGADAPATTMTTPLPATTTPQPFLPLDITDYTTALQISALQSSAGKAGGGEKRFSHIFDLFPLTDSQRGANAAATAEQEKLKHTSTPPTPLYRNCNVFAKMVNPPSGVLTLCKALNVISPKSIEMPPAPAKVAHPIVGDSVSDVFKPLDEIFRISRTRLTQSQDNEALPNIGVASKSLFQAKYNVTSTKLEAVVKNAEVVPIGQSSYTTAVKIKGHPYVPVHYAMAQGRAEAVDTLIRKHVTPMSDFKFGPDNETNIHEQQNKEAESTVLVPVSPNPAQPSEELRRKANAAIDSEKPPEVLPPPPPVRWIPGYYQSIMDRVHTPPIYDYETMNTFRGLIRCTYLPKLWWSCRLNILEAVSHACSVMADVDVVGDDGGLTPLMIAAWYGHYDVVNALLDVGMKPEKGVRLQTVTAGEVTALHIACLRNQSSVAGLLVGNSRGNIIDTKDECGNTPLHLASMRNSYSLVKSLLCSDANIFEKNNEGDTAELIGMYLRNRNTTRLLYWWTNVSRFTSTESQREYIAKLSEIPLPASHSYVTAWFKDSNTYHASLDTLTSDYLPMNVTDPNESVPCLLYHKICRAGSDQAAKSVLNQLVFHMWPEQVREIDLGGTYIGPKGISNVLQLLTVLPNVESVDLSGNRLDNGSVVELCEYARVHPGLRRLILNNNKNIARVGGHTLLKLLKANPRIFYVDVASTQVDVPLQEKLRWQTEENKRTLAQRYSAEATATLLSSSISSGGASTNQSAAGGPTSVSTKRGPKKGSLRSVTPASSSSQQKGQGEMQRPATSMK